MKSSDIRRQFIDFFVQKHGHTFVPSSSVVPHDDPTLLFTNAGMNQFKPIFLGTEKRTYTRAVNTQKCIRAGGKHNDLDDVGRSRRHHTFFEMLGNWSFGDYFKQGAIEMSWELLTKVWKLDPTRLHVSCFEGDEKNGVPRDTEAADIWRKVANWEQYGHKSDDHIHYFGKDNFWEMGDTGPCGPCTEIYYDRTPDKTGGKLVNGEDPRVMEIWNNVFIQYNRNPDRSLVTLPSQHVDTGMGFERICQVLQDVDSNYSIDLWNPYWEALKKISGHTYGGKFPKTNSVDVEAEAADADLRKDIAFRVIGDHLRCLTFALTDGAVPSNEGRGYVLRRILRRAVRFGRQQLDLREPFLHNLVPVVVESMGDAFPELKKNPKRVSDLILDEEISFGKTLDRGIALFEQAAQSQIANRKSQISAEDAFKLHDTYGFPIDLTQIMAAERGMSVDTAGYEKLMEEARERARAGGKEANSAVYDLPPAALAELGRGGAKPTDDSAKFAGEPIQARVLAIWNGSNLDPSADTSSDQEVAVILDRTNFYAEMGGQVGDAGLLRALTPSPGTPGEGRGEGQSSRAEGRGQRAEEARFDVETARIVGGYILHIGRVRNGCLKVGDTVTATLAPSRRATMQNHTGTHLANWALREVLGDDVQQKGSLVDPEKLRFDFSHGKSMQDDEVIRVEKLVSQCIEKKLPVYAETAPQDKALKIHGLRAVFGEKYPPNVRVVSIGAAVADLLKDPSNTNWRKYSIEFCGGTHLTNTSEVEDFVITGEESVSKGVRRIIALTGEHARTAVNTERELEHAIAEARNAPEAQLPQTLNALQKRLGGEGLPLRAKRRGQAAIAELQQKYRAWEKSQQKSSGAAIDIAAVATDLVSRGKVIVSAIDGASDDQLRALMDSIKKRSPSYAVMLGATDGQKVSLVAAVSDDLIAGGLKAGDWIRETAKVAGGGGGGRPQMAQAGGKDPSKLADALQVARQYASERVKG
jgi:alanyl-tRNA synthetase